MDSNSSGESSKKKKQKVDKRKRDWLQDCKDLFGSRENALKAIEEHAVIHYKPLVQTSLRRLDEVCVCLRYLHSTLLICLLLDQERIYYLARVFVW